MKKSVAVEGSTGFRRTIARALLELAQHELIAKRIVERSRIYVVASADAETGTIRINFRRLSARQRRNLDLIASILVHENHHLRQGPVDDWNRDIAKFERGAYRKQVRYLEAVGNHKLARHIRTVGRANILEETKITYI